MVLTREITNIREVALCLMAMNIMHNEIRHIMPPSHLREETEETINTQHILPHTTGRHISMILINLQLNPVNGDEISNI
jgi:hypothetical protein